MSDENQELINEGEEAKSSIEVANINPPTSPIKTGDETQERISDPSS